MNHLLQSLYLQVSNQFGSLARNLKKFRASDTTSSVESTPESSPAEASPALASVTVEPATPIAETPASATPAPGPIDLIAVEVKELIQGLDNFQSEYYQQLYDKEVLWTKPIGLTPAKATKWNPIAVTKSVNIYENPTTAILSSSGTVGEPEQVCL